MDYNDPLPKVLQLYLTISQYPVLSRQIRQRMREEIFSRGIVSATAFEREVRQKAIESQTREGLTDPFSQESPQDWDKRVRYIRAHLGDFYFAYNLPISLFEQILEEVLTPRAPDREVRLTFNPEIAPWDWLFAEADRYMRMPEGERTQVQHHLREIIVVLIKAMISDQLQFVGLAKEVFSVYDLKAIRDRRIGRGKIGGKAAGMLMAWKLVQHAGAAAGIDPATISIPDSYYVASDVFYEAHEFNNLHQIMNQKYKSREEIVREYPEIRERYQTAHLPEHVLEELGELLERIGPTPLIFRSSSLLEDSFTTSFAGKYDSYFLPNNGTREENLVAAERAILDIYASTLSPDALIYRQRMGLVDFDERMAILIQKVEGQRHGNYYYPTLAGVGFSRNPFRWSPKIRREDGLLRIVCGLGTRAVDRVDNDYPRMIALSHPHLRPETRVEQLRQYSQHLIDVLNIKTNTFETLPISKVIDTNYPALRLVAALDTGQALQPFISKPAQVDPARLVFTFDSLAQQKDFTDTMRNLLAYLEKQYQRPVDVEYTIEVTKTWPRVELNICLLQCRPLSEHEGDQDLHVPEDIPLHQQLFTAHRQVPQGVVKGVRYIVYVQPEAYLSIRDTQRRLTIGRIVGQLNEKLQHEQFVLMGPGRWGTSNIQLGVKASYADIFNSRALIEIAYSDDGNAPEMAYGTHFFQDLVEAQIFPLALFPNDEGVHFNWDFFNNAANVLSYLLPDAAPHADIIKVIDVPAVAEGRSLEIVMDAAADYAMGYLRYYH